ncbi:hypothetical protein AgCh_024311 [Apium graveolens]
MLSGRAAALRARAEMLSGRAGSGKKLNYFRLLLLFGFQLLSQTCENILHGYSVESTTYRAFVVDQQKVIESQSAQFNNPMLQAVKGEINGIDDSYPSNGMAVYNTTHCFNEAIQQGFLSDEETEKVTEALVDQDWLGDCKAPDAHYTWNWTLVYVYKALLVVESKEEVNAKQFMNITIADQLNSVYLFFTSLLQELKQAKRTILLGAQVNQKNDGNTSYIDIDYAGCKKHRRSISEAVNSSDRRSISGSCQLCERRLISCFDKKQPQIQQLCGTLYDKALSHQVLGEDTDPIAICQWSVSTSPGLNPLDASAYSGSDIDSSDESNKDGDLRTPIAPPVTSLRMAKVISLQVNNTTPTQEIRKNEDKANTKNQKIRRRPEVCLQMLNEKSTEQENHGNGSSSQIPEFDSINTGDKEKKDLAVIPIMKKMMKAQVNKLIQRSGIEVTLEKQSLVIYFWCED